MIRLVPHALKLPYNVHLVHLLLLGHFWGLLVNVLQDIFKIKISANNVTTHVALVMAALQLTVCLVPRNLKDFTEVNNVSV